MAKRKPPNEIDRKGKDENLRDLPFDWLRSCVGTSICGFTVGVNKQISIEENADHEICSRRIRREKRRKVKEKERGEISEDDTINTTWISTTGYDDDEKRDTFEDRSRENTTLVARRRKDKESKKRRRKKRTTVGPRGASGGLSSLW